MTRGSGPWPGAIRLIYRPPAGRHDRGLLPAVGRPGSHRHPAAGGLRVAEGHPCRREQDRGRSHLRDGEHPVQRRGGDGRGRLPPHRGGINGHEVGAGWPGGDHRDRRDLVGQERPGRDVLRARPAGPQGAGPGVRAAPNGDLGAAHRWAGDLGASGCAPGRRAVSGRADRAGARNAHEPLLAVDVARELDTPGNLRDRTQLVRAELRGCEAFTEASRGRWELGRPSGHEAARLPMDEVVDYWDRVHQDTRRTWPSGGNRSGGRAQNMA